MQPHHALTNLIMPHRCRDQSSEIISLKPHPINPPRTYLILMGTFLQALPCGHQLLRGLTPLTHSQVFKFLKSLQQRTSEECLSSSHRTSCLSHSNTFPLKRQTEPSLSPTELSIMEMESQGISTLNFRLHYRYYLY